ncbi:MAG: long-chain fatty acid--CoA ligase, partial [Calditrichaeota bacterium]|nr:long-chain fatty acid--CoA ligase [Calditrichota bacterium]
MEPKPWFNHYDEGVPHSLQPYPEKTLLDIVAETARQRPQLPAMTFKGARLSYAQFDALSRHFASGVAHWGLQKGEHVGLLLPNSPQMLIAQFGAWKAGAVVAPLNPLYTERELLLAFQKSEATLAVVLAPFYEKVKAVQTETRLRRILTVNIKTFLPPMLRFLFTLFKEKKEGYRPRLRDGDQDFDAFLKSSTALPEPNVQVDGDDPALLMFSGGTTGTPKAALGLHKHLVISGTQFQAWFGAICLEWTDPIMALMPLFHIYAQAGSMATAIVGHHPLVLVPNPRDLNDVIASIEKEKPAFMPAVPTLFNAMLNHPKVVKKKANLRSLKLCISGAAPLLLETKQRFEQATGGRIVEAYALTESMLAGVITPVHGTYKPGAVGIPLPDVEIKIVDTETGTKELQPEEVGEILLRAPQLMAGYWKNPEETATTIRNGWLYTGDIGFLDKDGYLYIVDRKKDLIKPSGFQVWPREVEEVIAAHPAVAEVGVAGVPDAYQSEAVKAWVVLREGHHLTTEELRAYCKQKLT